MKTERETFSTSLLQRLEGPLHPNQTLETSLADVAGHLLFETQLLVAGQPYRLHEIEFYLFSDGHPDPFAHRQPLQRTCGRWYFHRQGSAYRGGSFKGLDITFGPASSWGGILIRSLSGPEGRWVVGPSLVVDHLLEQTGCVTVAELDDGLVGAPITDPGCLSLAEREPSEDETGGAQIWATARVGLSLKREHEHPSMPDYLGRRYRFLNAPRRISKGRPYLVLSMHEHGVPPAEIANHLNSPPSIIRKQIQAYERGRREGRPVPTGDRGGLRPLELCQLLGALAASRV